MKVIDYDKKGNVVRLYLGDDKLTNYYGDDWNDYPASHNAGTVYEEYISGLIDFVIPFDYYVVSAEEDWHYGGNEPFCKDDYKDNKAPCLVIGKPKEHYFDFCYSEEIANKNAVQIYFNTPKEEVIGMVTNLGGFILKERSFTYNKKERTLYDEEGNKFSRY